MSVDVIHDPITAMTIAHIAILLCARALNQHLIQNVVPSVQFAST